MNTTTWNQSEPRHDGVRATATFHLNLVYDKATHGLPHLQSARQAVTVRTDEVGLGSNTNSHSTPRRAAICCYMYSCGSKLTQQLTPSSHMALATTTNITVNGDKDIIPLKVPLKTNWFLAIYSNDTVVLTVHLTFCEACSSLDLNECTAPKSWPRENWKGNPTKQRHGLGIQRITKNNT